MSIKLDNLSLSGVKGQISLGLRSETSSVKRIGIINGRRLIKHKVPGVYGTIIEDEGKDSARLLIEGQFVGDDAINGISSLRKKYKKGEPLDLISDMTLLSNINKVMIEDLRIQMNSSAQLSYEYEMILREYVDTPKKPSLSAPSQKVQALADIGSEAATALQELKQTTSAASEQVQDLREAGAKAAGKLQEVEKDLSAVSQKAKAMAEAGAKAAGKLQEVEKDLSAVSQKAKAMADVGSKAVDVIKGLDDAGTSPSQKAQAIAEVGSQASKVLKDLAKD